VNKRADARANHEKLLAAAETVFRQEGAHAPLQHIAEAAGVGRGTLYRHFEDRTALIVALFEQRIDHLVAIAQDPSAPELAAERTLRETLDIQRATPGLSQVVMSSQSPLLTELSQHSTRLEESLHSPVRAAIDAGRIYPDVTARDFLVSWAMFEGVTATYNEPQYRDRVERARILVLRSILTPAAH
jgi:AcrR family transcriptional regulator